MRSFLSLALVPFAIAASFPPLNTSDVAAIHAEIFQFYQFPASGTYGIPCNPCQVRFGAKSQTLALYNTFPALPDRQFGDSVGALVRLPFHDALGGGRPNGKGGPNGCVDFTFSGNNGLQAVVAQLSAIYKASWSTTLSFADFIVIAGNAAIVAATTVTGEACCGLYTPKAPLVLPFQYGRVDDPSCDGVDGAFLPSALNTYAQTAANFVTRVGMSYRELVAIIGAHTLGRCETANSGFNGGWTGYQSSFSNSFYQVLAGEEWNNKDAPTGSWSGAAPGGPAEPPLVMLKGSDVEIMISPSDSCNDFNELNFTTATPTPRPGTSCPVNATNKATITEFLNDQDAFWETFSDAWKVMTEFTYPDLKPPVGAPVDVAAILRAVGTK